MEAAIVSGLLVALITGITFLAYKHPTAFSRLYWPLFFVLLSASIGIGAWNGSITETLAVLKDFIPPAQLQAATLKTQELKLASWYSWVFPIAVIYLVFLLWLPHLLSEDKKKEKPKNE